MAANLPTGTVTFLFTDIEGSTRLWEQHGEAMKTVLARHDELLRQAIETRNGHIIKSTGDGVHAAFETALDGALAALQAQQTLISTEWGEIEPQNLRIRIGVHTGEAEARAGDYFGPALNRAARLMSIGHGGQILLSNTTASLVRDHLQDGTSLRDLGEHRLKDLIRSEHVYQLIHPSLPADFPSLNSLDAFPNNLPVQLTSFIGRERELSEAKKRLAPARLLTLIGPGGTGKTRLSLQLAADLLLSFVDGVWLVELASLSNPSLVLQAVASVFGLREQLGMRLDELVINYLRAKNLLLVMDNCEHLVDSCAQLADQLLHACPNLKIIASSREALGIAGETVYRVPSLSLPKAEKATPEALMQCESAQLFIDRASAANPRFSLNELNAPAISQICQRLDGIPLALELAAARITVFPPEQIASRLDDRFRLLTGGSRTALPRQQTLRALIDWSYELLSEEERALLRRLSVFAGGWTFEEAEAVCTGLDVLSLLPQLVNKSLVALDEDEEPTRYHLLETVRQYARDKLLEAGESELARNAHLDYFIRFMQEARPEIDKLQNLDWMKRVEVEHDNLRVALAWGLENNLEAILDMVWMMTPFWLRRGHDVEGRHWLDKAIDRANALSIPEGENGLTRKKLRAYAFEARAMVEFNQGDNHHALADSERAADLARQMGDARLLALALGYEISTASIQGDAGGTEVILREAVSTARATQDKLSRGLALAMAGLALRRFNKADEEVHNLVEEGLAALRESGNRWGYTMAVFSVGMAARFDGEFAEARLSLAACESIFREMGDMHRVNMIKSELAHIERHLGHYQQAKDMYKASIIEWARIGHRAAIAHQLECLAAIAKVEEEGARAARLYGAAEALREKIEIPMTAQERIEYEREITELRSGMNEGLFKQAWAEGRTMSMEQAIDFARG